VQGRTERLFIGCGVGGTVLLFAGLVLGHLLPPPSPSWDATKITAFYRQHLAAMRWGSILMAFGAALIGPWLGVMAKDLKGIPRYGSIVAYCQTALGALLVFEIVLPVTVLQSGLHLHCRVAGDGGGDHRGCRDSTCLSPLVRCLERRHGRALVARHPCHFREERSLHLER